MIKDNRGILGLNTVKAFIVVLLALAIIGVVTLIVLGALSEESLIAGTRATNTGVNFNETFTNATQLNNLSVSTANSFRSPICTNHIFTNATGGGLITLANVTLTDNGCQWLGLQVSEFKNNPWNVTYAFSDKGPSGVEDITTNVSTGIVAFFTNSATFFSLLAVVVIILIISLVIVVVNRFGGETGGTAGDTSTL